MTADRQGREITSAGTLSSGSPLSRASGSLLSRILAARHDPVARILNVDLVAVAVATLLPWSTSGVSIGMALWLVALVPTVDWRSLLHSLRRPVSWLPIALVVLVAVGTLWSDAPWAARSYALSPAMKLLALPLLLYHFQRSTRGMWVFVAFLVSCTLMMAMSWLVMLYPGLSLKRDDVERGIFVKNYIDQSQEFALCAVALAYPAAILLREKKLWPAVLLIAVAASFLLNMAFVIVSRTAIVTMPVMLAVFALLHLKRRTSLVISATLIVLAGLAWAASPQLRWTAETFVRDYQLYKERNVPTSIGLRLEYWQKSLQFFAEAPLIGHGTGSTRHLFEMVATGTSDVATSKVINNPHNQTLYVAIQWGAIGIVILYATWLCHLLLFRGEGLVAWVGLLVVVQNIFTSLFNSHLFDFHEGWMYVLGAGVAGGTVLRARAGAAVPEPARAARP
jgi:O-antigen ligase